MWNWDSFLSFSRDMGILLLENWIWRDLGIFLLMECSVEKKAEGSLIKILERLPLGVSWVRSNCSSEYKNLKDRCWSKFLFAIYSQFLMYREKEGYLIQIFRWHSKEWQTNWYPSSNCRFYGAGWAKSWRNMWITIHLCSRCCQKQSRRWIWVKHRNTDNFLPG